MRAVDSNADRQQNDDRADEEFPHGDGPDNVEGYKMIR